MTVKVILCDRSFKGCDARFTTAVPCMPLTAASRTENSACILHISEMVFEMPEN